MEPMKTLKARVEKGRLVMNEPTELPEGTEVELVMADEVDDFADMDPEDRAALEESLRVSEEQIARGETRPASEILDRLRKM